MDDTFLYNQTVLGNFTASLAFKAFPTGDKGAQASQEGELETLP